MLTLTKLADAEYLITQVAQGIEEYYLGRGEAPGVWQGAWATELGLDGLVDHEALRSLLDGIHPATGEAITTGHRPREVRAFDATFSAPKSVSLLWAFGTEEVRATAAIAHVESVAAALDVLEQRCSTTRQQVGGIRRRVPTRGLAVATFVHRTSRDGDPQLHTHCVIPNLVQRADGSVVALDAHPLYEWKRAIGSIYAEELRTRLTRRLGVEWGPDRNGTREMVGFTPEQLRRFSKRTVAIEEHLAALAIDHADRVAAMRADDAASVATRPAKDPTLTPEVLRGRWDSEAREVGLPIGEALAAAVSHRGEPDHDLDREALIAHLIDPDSGLCARRSRFTEAHVVEAVAAWGGGRFDAAEVLELTRAFLRSQHVVRLVEPAPEGSMPTSPRWSTVGHLALEQRVLADLQELASLTVAGVDPDIVEGAVSAQGGLGADQAQAVRALTAPGPALRLLTAPAGYGKTTAVHAAATAQVATGRRVLGLATTNQAAAELRDVGIEAMTLARFSAEDLSPNTTLVLDEVSQVPTADVAWLLTRVLDTPGAQLWALGDARQGRAVRAGGLAAELERLVADGALPAISLTENRRQQDAVEREALARFRDGEVAESQAIRTEAGWEHDCGSPSVTRQAMAEAVVADIDRHDPFDVVALTVSHGDAEDLADRIREIRTWRGQLGGETLTGPGWGMGERHYAAGDLVLVHTNRWLDGRRLHNGTVLAVTEVTESGLAVSDRSGHGFVLPTAFVTGRRPDGAPNLSHAWARTVDGAQGGTWSQVHLLGTAALDRYTGYVGQSRGRQPTHTWNVTRLTDVDHGGVVLTREPASEVLTALERDPAVAFASHDDPNVLDRRLRAERAEHEAVIAARPPEVDDQLRRARDRLAQVRHEAATAGHGLELARREARRVGPLARLSGDGRRRLQAAESMRVHNQSRLDGARPQIPMWRGEVDRLERTATERQTWDAEHAWRLDRVAEIDDRLAHLWAGAVLAATRQGDPLAFGVDRLRQGRRTHLADLRAIEVSLPPDRSAFLARAESDYRHHRVQAAHAARQVERAERDLELVRQRHWGRRDRDATAKAERELALARHNASTTAERLQAARARLGREERAQLERADALRATEAPRVEATTATRELTLALDETRAARVLAAAQGLDASELTGVLGTPPDHPTARAVWCAIAERIEARLDAAEFDVDRPSLTRTFMSDHARDPVSALIERAPELLKIARELPANSTALEPASWQQVLDSTIAAYDVLHPAPVMERSIDLGIEL